MKQDRVNIEERLRTRLRMLEVRARGVEEVLREPEETDLEERAAEWDDDTVLERLVREDRDEIRRIRAAIERLEAGTYGKCEACGRAIARRRLAIVPQAARCIRCARSEP